MKNGDIRDGNKILEARNSVEFVYKGVVLSRHLK